MAEAHMGGQQVQDEEEESYFVPMTDLMVGMLFIFIILLMTFALTYRQAEDHMTGSQDARSKMLSDVQKSLVDIGVSVEIFPDTGVVRLPEDLLFPSGLAELNDEGAQVVGYIGHILRTTLPCYAIAPADVDLSHCGRLSPNKLETVLIEGHTDDRPLKAGGRYRDNWDLSAARAIATYRALVGDGEVIPALENSRGEKLIAVSGYGEQRPIDSNDTEQGRRNNRRIDLRFLMTAPEPVTLAPDYSSRK